MLTAMTIKRIIILSLVLGFCGINAQGAQKPILGGIGGADECHNTVINSFCSPDPDLNSKSYLVHSVGGSSWRICSLLQQYSRRLQRILLLFTPKRSDTRVHYTTVFTRGGLNCDPNHQSTLMSFCSKVRGPCNVCRRLQRYRRNHD
jgi:hypothetical protein